VIKNETTRVLQELSALADEAESKWLELSTQAQEELDNVFHEGVGHHIRWLQNNMSNLLNGDIEMKEILSNADHLDAKESGSLDRIDERKKDLYIALNSDPMDTIKVEDYLKDGFGRDIVTIFALENDNIMLAEMLVEIYELQVGDDIAELAESEVDPVTQYKPGF